MDIVVIASCYNSESVMMNEILQWLELWFLVIETVVEVEVGS